jgi:AcrR family transcriptional regulator
MVEIRSPSSARSRIVEVADRLFYERGFEATSFADIATDAGLSRGNFYYHFKSKDEILAAVISLRMDRTREMLTVWESECPEPADRLLAFANILIANRAKIMVHGCPVGTLCAELAKLEHGAQNETVAIFTLFRDWLTRQFVVLGHGENADALAMHMLMRSQGVASLATAFRDEAFIVREVDALAAWLAQPTL